MELVYLWVEEFKNIKQIGFSFSTRFKVDFKLNEKLGYKQIQIEESPEQRRFFDNKVDNVTAIIGKNGSGKTNILDLIGLRMEERKRYRNAKYFMIYHHKDNMFSIEGSDFKLVSSNIEGYPNQKGSLDMVTEPYSLLLEKQKGMFKYADFLQFNEIQYNKLNIFNLRNIFREGYSKHGFKPEMDYSNFFQRIYLNPTYIGDYAKYKLLTHFNRLVPSVSKEQGLVFNLNEKVLVKVFPNIHVVSFQEVKLNLIFQKSFFRKETDNQLPITMKEKFIIGFLKKYFYYSFESCTELIRVAGGDSEKIEEMKTEIESFKNLGNDKIYLLDLLKIVYSYVEKENLDYANMEGYVDALSKLLSFIEKLKEEYFSEDKISIPVGREEEEVVADLLCFIDEVKFDEFDYLNNAIKISIEPMSSGEEALMNIFSAMFFGIQHKINSKNEKAIILMDEPDVFMHPEWSRVFLSEVFNFLETVKNEYYSYQLIITTHSPFIVSDLPKDNIITIEKNPDKGLCEIVHLNNQEQTFANNIHSLLSNKFFMEATIGEFAKKKIDKVIEVLNDKKNSTLTLEEEREVKAIIDIIGEPVLKHKLNEMYLLKTPEYKRAVLKDQIRALNQELKMLESDGND